MEISNIHRVKAIHPHWTGFLRLSTVGNLAEHEGRGSKGSYDLTNERLTVFWDKFAPDVFLECCGAYVHERLIGKTPDAARLFAVNIKDKFVALKSISVLVPGSRYEVTLRIGTTDIPTFEQVFINSEYASPNLPESAKVIVDLGANIGLATVFFALRYREAEILSIEPEENNFDLLKSNTMALGTRVKTQRAAVWTKDGFINLHTESDSGVPLGEWGAQVSDRNNSDKRSVKCNTVGSLLHEAGFANVDILKIDVEGAELELFSDGVEEWLAKIKLIIIETHDRFRPGSEDAVRRALTPAFGELPRLGENLFFRRLPK
jgi:FkbM family methyltransferase